MGSCRLDDEWQSLHYCARWFVRLRRDRIRRRTPRKLREKGQNIIGTMNELSIPTNGWRCWRLHSIRRSRDIRRATVRTWCTRFTSARDFPMSTPIPTICTKGLGDLSACRSRSREIWWCGADMRELWCVRRGTCFTAFCMRGRGSMITTAAIGKGEGRRGSTGM